MKNGLSLGTAKALFTSKKNAFVQAKLNGIPQSATEGTLVSFTIDDYNSNLDYELSCSWGDTITHNNGSGTATLPSTPSANVKHFIRVRAITDGIIGAYGYSNMLVYETGVSGAGLLFENEDLNTFADIGNDEYQTPLIDFGSNFNNILPKITSKNELLNSSTISTIETLSNVSNGDYFYLFKVDNSIISHLVDNVNSQIIAENISLIPIMTTNTSYYGTITSSSQANIPNPWIGKDYCAFDNSNTSYWTCGSSGWIQFNFNIPKAINSILIRNSINTSWHFKNYTFKGSHNGLFLGEETTLYAINDVLFNGQENKIFSFDNDIPFEYIRIYCNGVGFGGATAGEISNIKMFSNPNVYSFDISSLNLQIPPLYGTTTILKTKTENDNHLIKHNIKSILSDGENILIEYENRNVSNSQNIQAKINTSNFDDISKVIINLNED